MASVWGDGRAAVVTGDGLDRRPAHQGGALLGYVATVGLVVRFPVAGSEPGPAAQVAGVGEAGDVADLGHYAERAVMPNASSS